MSLDIVNIDRASVNIAKRFLARVSGDRPIIEAWLYGSRARGDARADSDLDIALIVDETRDEARRFGSHLAGEAVDELLSFGVLISPLVIAQGDWDHPEEFTNPFLLRNVRQEGMRL